MMVIPLEFPDTVALSTYASSYSCRAAEDGNILGKDQFNVSKVVFTSWLCQMANMNIGITEMCVSLAVLCIWCWVCRLRLLFGFLFSMKELTAIGSGSGTERQKWHVKVYLTWLENYMILSCLIQEKEKSLARILLCYRKRYSFTVASFGAPLICRSLMGKVEG